MPRQRMSPQGGKRVSRWTFAAGRIIALAAFLFEVGMSNRIIFALTLLAPLAGAAISALARYWGI